jgi:secondary thiamine-phosphate synthase enzyme
MLYQQKLQFSTRGRGTCNITREITDVVRNSGIKSGICHLFIQHTSASLIFCENADPTVQEDLDNYMAKLVKDGDSIYKHNDEGPDDMAAHIRTILTQSSLSIPVTEGKCNLGIWQGIYLWEHRTHAHRRNIAVTIMGE